MSYTKKRPSFPVQPQKIVVLMGGHSQERSVSLTSGECVCSALRDIGHHVVAVDPRDSLMDFLSQIHDAFDGPTGQKGPDVIFNTLHGGYGENGILQGVLEMLKIPYTASGPLGAAISMHKPISRRIAQSVGLSCPLGEEMSLKHYQAEGFPIIPHIIKPIDQGSSLSVHLIETPAPDADFFQNWSYGDRVLIEQYIPGRELSVAVLSGEAAEIIEVIFPGKIFPFRGKFSSGHVQYIVPAPIHPQAYTQALHMAQAIYRATECRGGARVDFRYDDTAGEPGKLYYLEINTTPGMTPYSMFPKIMAAAGWSFQDIVQQMVQDASCGSP